MGDQGTVTFFPVSRILDLTFQDRAGNRQLLFGEESHDASLGNEAADFVRYIRDPAGTREEYLHHRETSKLASRLTAEIRRQCEIVYR